MEPNIWCTGIAELRPKTGAIHPVTYHEASNEGTGSATVCADQHRSWLTARNTEG